MKPLHLNLASRPYRDYRPVYAVVVLTSLLVAFLMYTNIGTYYQYVHETKSSRTKIAQLESQAAGEKRRADAARNQLARINVKTLDAQTRFINTQLAERAFSWSELLDRLEAVLADDVRISSIAPSFSPDGNVRLTLQCTAKDGNGMIEMLNRFHADPHFANPFPSAEVNTGAGFTFDLALEYKPSLPKVVAR